MDARAQQGPYAGQRFRGAPALWSISAALIAVGLSQGLFVAAVMLGMFIVVALDLGQSLGIPVYWTVLVGAAAAYWLIIHVTVKLIGRSTPVPCVVWPSMLAPPLGWGILWLVAPWPMEVPFGALIGLVGPVAAWFTLGRNRWTHA